MSNHYQTIVEKAYNAFNERNIEAVISLMHPNVQWPNSMEGRYLTGTEEVREYWQRQWKEMDPHVMPLSINEEKDLVKVKVHQVIKDLQGKLLADEIIRHIYTFKNGLIIRMEIKKV